jgi:hypothetical protein
MCTTPRIDVASVACPVLARRFEVKKLYIAPYAPFIRLSA